MIRMMTATLSTMFDVLQVKPFCQWEKLDMSSLERRKLLCSVTFHLVAIICVIWSLYVLIDRTAEEIRTGVLAWPFWTKLVVVGIGFSGGLVFMYVQCKVYIHLFKKWRAYNRIIVVQDAPEGIHKSPTTSNANNHSSRDDRSSSFRQERSQGGDSEPPEASGLNPNGAGSSSGHHKDRAEDAQEVGAGAAKGMSNAETQTALRGVSLMEVVSDGPSGSSDNSNKKNLKMVAVLDGSDQDDESGGAAGAAAFFFTECECSSDKMPAVKLSEGSSRPSAPMGVEGQRNGALPGSPLENPEGPST